VVSSTWYSCPGTVTFTDSNFLIGFTSSCLRPSLTISRSQKGRALLERFPSRLYCDPKISGILHCIRPLQTPDTITIQSLLLVLKGRRLGGRSCWHVDLFLSHILFLYRYHHPMRPKGRRVTIDKSKKKPSPERWTGTILDLQGIGHGISGMVLIIDELRVIKVAFGTPRSKRDMETERKAYGILEQAISPSPHIIRCFELDNPQGLVLERCRETVRHRLRSIPELAVLPDVDLRKWSKQAAEGLAFLHDHQIIHADVGCHNMLLDSSDVLKLCDFAGSSVQGSPASTVYELWSQLPSENEDKPTKTSDLFALGSAIYELSTKERPYHEKSLVEVRGLYQRQQFPPMKNDASLGHVIISCWSQKYASASEVVHDIDPQLSICCCPLEDAALEPVLRSENGMETSRTKGTSSTSLSTSIPKASKFPARASRPSSNTSASWSFTSASSSGSSNRPLSIWPPKTDPIKSPVDNDDHEQLSENEAKHQRQSDRASGKHNKKHTKRKTRNQNPISQWMSKSIRFNRSHSP
jgi:serine/threonine protein kinase